MSTCGKVELRRAKGGTRGEGSRWVGGTESRQSNIGRGRRRACEAVQQQVAEPGPEAAPLLSAPQAHNIE
jgi:hypothetical protein